MSYFTRISTPTKTANYPFSVVPWTGAGRSGYMVSNGTAFSSFSFDSGSFVPIQGLNSFIDFQPNTKIYLDVTVLPNLQISGAQIKCTKVGSDAGAIDNKINPSMWYNYPNMCYIQPGDITDSNGRVTHIVDGKRQYKSYLLIAYRSDDSNKNGNSVGAAQSSSSQSNNFSVVQVASNDIIYMASQVSGVPVIFPMPFFNGTNHVNAINNN
jgi:hypothetical protein